MLSVIVKTGSWSDFAIFQLEMFLTDVVPVIYMYQLF